MAPLLAARQDAAGERGQEARPERRRLAAPRRADQAQEAAPDQPRHQLGHEALTPEVILSVGGFERRQTLVGTDRDRRRGARGDAVRGLVQRKTTGPVADELQVGHIVDQLVLGLAEGPATRFRAIGGRAQPAGRGRACPGRRDAMDRRRDAARLSGDIPHREIVDRPPRVERRDRPHIVQLERSEAATSLMTGERLDQSHQRRGGLLAVRQQEERRRLGRASSRPRRPPGGAGWVPHRDRPRPAGWRNGGSRGQQVFGIRALAAGRIADGAALGMDDRRELRRKPGLADARRSRDDHGAAVPVAGAPPVPAQPAQLHGPTRQRDDRLKFRRQRADMGQVGRRIRPLLRARVADAHRVDRPVDALELLGWEGLERDAGHGTSEVAAGSAVAMISPAAAEEQSRRPC